MAPSVAVPLLGCFVKSDIMESPLCFELQVTTDCLDGRNAVTRTDANEVGLGNYYSSSKKHTGH